MMYYEYVKHCKYLRFYAQIFLSNMRGPQRLCTVVFQATTPVSEDIQRGIFADNF